MLCNNSLPFWWHACVSEIILTAGFTGHCSPVLMIYDIFLWNNEPWIFFKLCMGQVTWFLSTELTHSSSPVSVCFHVSPHTVILNVYSFVFSGLLVPEKCEWKFPYCTHFHIFKKKKLILNFCKAACHRHLKTFFFFGKTGSYLPIIKQL